MWMTVVYEKSINGDGKAPWAVGLMGVAEVTRKSLEVALEALQDPTTSPFKNLNQVPKMILVFDQEPSLAAVGDAIQKGIPIGKNLGVIECIDLVVSTKDLA